MKKPTVKCSKGEIGQVRIVDDFLPSPDRLVLREDNVKVTLSLSQRSVTFFKRAALERRVPYQRMSGRWWTPTRRSRKARGETFSEPGFTPGSSGPRSSHPEPSFCPKSA